MQRFSRVCEQGLELGQWSVGSGLQLVMGASRYAEVAQARCYWSWFLLLDQNLQKMGVFLTLHHEDMCILDVYVHSKRLRCCLGCSAGEGFCWHTEFCAWLLLGQTGSFLWDCFIVGVLTYFSEHPNHFSEVNFAMYIYFGWDFLH